MKTCLMSIQKVKGQLFQETCMAVAVVAATALQLAINSVHVFMYIKTLK